MPTLMSIEDYRALKRKYQAEAQAQNNPQVGEFLSGQAQHLKAAPNAVDYKNFNGPNIEETTLVKTAFNQNLTTNITENYESGVTSTITEVAPSIHHETNLTDSYSATYQSATENINVQSEVQNIDVTNWQATHQNLNLTVPGTLRQQIMQSGNITVDQYQAQIQHQTIKAETYTHNFDTATFDGPVNIQSSGQIHFGGDIHIGPSEAIKKSLLPAHMQNPIYDFHIVNTDGIYYHLTDSIDFAEITGDFDLEDYFEDERWVPSEQKEGEEGLNRSQMARAGGAGMVAAAAPIVYKMAVKRHLIDQLQQMYPQLKTQVPHGGGVLLQANYQICTGMDQEYYQLNNVFVAGSGEDYNPLIKKAMSSPAAIATPDSKLCHWEYLYIWVTTN